MKTAVGSLSGDRIEHFAILGMQTASLVHEMNNQLATIVDDGPGISREIVEREA